MKVVLSVALTLFLCWPAHIARAVSISGIVLYTTEDFGIPNSIEATQAGNLTAQLWRTALSGPWHGLGIWAGVPPDSLRTPPLNAPNFMVEIPLNEGENVFTILGQPGPLTETDDYQRFAVNLFFDGNIAGPPGISVLLDRYAAPGGNPPSANRSDYIYSLLLEQQIGVKPQSVYDDGIQRVTVTAGSFLPPKRFDPPSEFDLLSAQIIRPDGVKDFIGVLKVFVEPSTGDGSAVGGIGGGGLRPVVPAAGLGGVGGPYLGSPAVGGTGVAVGPDNAGAIAPPAHIAPTNPSHVAPTAHAVQPQTTPQAAQEAPTVQTTGATTAPTTATTRAAQTPTAVRGTPTAKATTAPSSPTPVVATPTPPRATPTTVRPRPTPTPRPSVRPTFPPRYTPTIRGMRAKPTPTPRPVQR